MAHIEHTSSSYIIKDDAVEGSVGQPVEIHVEVEADGKLTIRTRRTLSNFQFTRSSPEIVRKIGELLIEASKLVDKKC